MSTDREPSEHEDRWILGCLRGMDVARICIDFRLTLTLDDGWEVVLEAPAQLSSGSLLTNPGLPLTPEFQDVAAALPLFGAKVLSAVAFKSGDLRMVFDSGMHLNCSADPSFEAWQISGPRGWRFVSEPGGDLAVWSPTGAGGNPPGRTTEVVKPEAECR
ncbi:DUF6188 family protein [Streptomyces sp. NPDC001581]|uniref:DUF6188 family protein n=1 Tax=Streptomyces sp. NPDC001581 TaxID=3154386 RepID=UPI00331E419D